MRNLYAPLDAVLDEFATTSIAKLRFVVRRVVDVSSWARAGEPLLDLRREGPFRGSGELAAIAQRELTEPWATGDADDAARAINTFATDHSDDFRMQRLSRSDDPAAVAEWEHDISRWLYSAEHIRLRYSLEYDGLSIERLSPGLRGIVLLLLYLAIDREETDPLLIDQPEENLDPESVYSELVKLFRAASNRRQIIMVTHNANLVVNTDVDQVIVAHCSPFRRAGSQNFDTSRVASRFPPSAKQSVRCLRVGRMRSSRERNGLAWTSRSQMTSMNGRQRLGRPGSISVSRARRSSPLPR